MLASSGAFRSWGSFCWWKLTKKDDVSSRPCEVDVELDSCRSLTRGNSKNHSKYTVPKLDAIINYIINAHPNVVSLYHDFDDLVKQILHINPLATQPTRQMIDDKLSLLPCQKLGPEEVEENWQSVDSIALSRALVQIFLL